MHTMLTRASDYTSGPSGDPQDRYGQVVYWTAPAAAPTVTHAITALPVPLQARITARDLPPGATQ